MTGNGNGKSAPCLGGANPSLLAALAATTNAPRPPPPPPVPIMSLSAIQALREGGGGDRVYWSSRTAGVTTNGSPITALNHERTRLHMLHVIQSALEIIDHDDFLDDSGEGEHQENEDNNEDYNASYRDKKGQAHDSSPSQ